MAPKAQIPEGTRDLLPRTTAQKRRLEDTILKLFQNWGYREVITPTMEYYHALSLGTGKDMQEKMYKLTDYRGRIIALRPEMTAPIARMVATKLNDHRLPIKLSYLANVFRHQPLKEGRHREFYQAGLECIGLKSPEVDAEVIALAIEALKACGLNHFSIDIGHVDFFQGLIEDFKLSPSFSRAIRGALRTRDFVALRELVEGSELAAKEQEVLLSLPRLRWKGEIPDQVLGLSQHPLVRNAFKELKQIIEHLQLLEVEDHFHLDLSLFRGFDYYTGMVFEAFTPELGTRICGGGRYDDLLGEYGLQLPATGFALGIDIILLALEKEENPFAPESGQALILYHPSQKKEAYKFFRDRLRQGDSHELELKERPLSASIKYAEEKNYRYLYYLGPLKKDSAAGWERITTDGFQYHRLKCR